LLRLSALRLGLSALRLLELGALRLLELSALRLLELSALRLLELGTLRLLGLGTLRLLELGALRLLRLSFDCLSVEVFFKRLSAEALGEHQANHNQYREKYALSS